MKTAKTIESIATHFDIEDMVCVDELIVALKNIKKSVPKGGRLGIEFERTGGKKMDILSVTFSRACFCCWINFKEA